MRLINFNSNIIINLLNQDGLGSQLAWLEKLLRFVILKEKVFL